ncbi:hypothetical protein CLV47_12340 [Antricoccus suffuscus]|uniref:Uncharacterized protein n=1 Tax=Antricoccus suffuscus TaxID=1629062 RepID=A0A2T0ZF85_9ACTN|nr:hypothetical protein [Antricoccus suffuscus]PRZ34808.1 hypothetical protein CLV47_12340 [Antricoccus suffuscus]
MTANRSIGSRWGAKAVDLRRVSAANLRRSSPAALSPVVADQSSPDRRKTPIRDLLRSGTDKARNAVIADRLADGWDQTRLVIIGSSAHAAGSSTVASSAAAAAVNAGQSVAIVDAHDVDMPGAADRLGVAVHPWSAVQHDPPGAWLEQQAEQWARETEGPLVVGSATGWVVPRPRVAGHVAQGIARSSRTLVIVELPPGPEAVGEYLRLIPLEVAPLVVWASRADAAELRRCAAHLRQVAEGVDHDLTRLAVLTVSHLLPRVGADVASAAASAADQTAGRVKFPFDSGLVPSAAALTPKNHQVTAAGRVVAACATLTR